MAGPRAAAAALLPAVLWAVLASWAAAAPAAPNGTLGAELERRWESLVARSLARLPVASQPKEAAVQSGAGDYLLGIKRLRRLYCNVGIGFHLQVLPDGRIGGVHADTSDSEWRGRAGARGRGPRAAAAPPRSRPAPAGGGGNRGGLGFRSLRRKDPRTLGPGRSRRWHGLGAPGPPSPASPPSEARAPGAGFQRLRPWARDERRRHRPPRGPGERVQVGAAWVLRSGTGRGRAGRPESPRPRPRGSGAPLHPSAPQKRGSRRLAGGGGVARARVPCPGVTGAPPPGLLELSPVERGVVSIFGVASRFFVAMSGKGKLYGSVSTAGAARHQPGPTGCTATPPGRPQPG